MPSVHVAWAVIIGVVIVTVTTSKWRWVALAHPAMTMIVVAVTGNHYWLDGIVAAAVLALAVVSEHWVRVQITRLRAARLRTPADATVS
jgi:hypothetical protein